MRDFVINMWHVIFIWNLGSSRLRITPDGELFTATDQFPAGISFKARVKVEDLFTEMNSRSAEAEIVFLVGQRPPQFYKPFYETSTPENVEGAE